MALSSSSDGDVLKPAKKVSADTTVKVLTPQPPALPSDRHLPPAAQAKYKFFTYSIGSFKYNNNNNNNNNNNKPATPIARRRKKDKRNKGKKNQEKIKKKMTSLWLLREAHNDNNLEENLAM